MCKIIQLRPGEMVWKDKLMNACFNNWHSYGLVTKIDGKLDIKRVVPKNGEISGEEVYKQLLEDIKYERILHVRHNTAGATDLRNTHPFDVYYDAKTGRQVVFMHNGTLYEYKSRVENDKGVLVEDETGASDTRNFTDEILIPYVQADFGTGPADIHNPAFKRLLQKFWSTPSSNRGILISSDQPSLFLGDWKESSYFDYTGKKNPFTTIKVSNTDYFDTVSRGPEFERRRFREEEERKSKEASKPEKRSFQHLGDVQIESTAGFAKRRVNAGKLSGSLKNIINDYDIWTRDGLAALGYATDKEIEELYSDKDSCVFLMSYIFEEFAKVCDELETTEKDKEKATKMIASLIGQLKALGKEVEIQNVA